MSSLIKSLLTVCFMAVGFTALIGCQQNVANNADETAPAPAKNSKEKEKSVILSFKGTIKLIELEGGFYGIITDKGQKILPMNISSEYLQDGAEIEFSGHYKNVMTIQQWGKPFTITEIKLIKAGKKKANPEF